MKAKIVAVLSRMFDRITQVRNGGTEGGAQRRMRPLVIAGLVLALLGGITIARAAIDTGAETVESQPSPTGLSPSPAESGVSPPEGGGGGGGINNEVVIRNITDGRATGRAGSGMARVTGGDVSNTNSAAAVSACTDCRTVAIAVQAVLVMGDSGNVSPKNQAAAINSNCLRCQSFALAYQYVVSTGGIVHFTSEGQQRIASLEAQIRDLAGSDLGFLDLEGQVDALVEKIWVVVRSETVKAGLKPEGKVSKAKDEAPLEGSASPSPSGSPAEQSPSPSESAAEQPSVTPSESSSPSVSTSDTQNSSSIGG